MKIDRLFYTVSDISSIFLFLQAQVLLYIKAEEADNLYDIKVVDSNL